MHDSFWTPETQMLGIGMLVALVAMIVLPIKVKVVDEQLGYFFLAIGGAMLWLSFDQGIVTYEKGEFVQILMHGHSEGLHKILGEPWMLLLFYFTLSLIAIVFHTQIENSVKAWANRMSPAAMIAIVTLTIGAMGSISVVVMATVGRIFFETLQNVTRKDYTLSVILFSAAIGISALCSTVGEPLSLFIARNLGEGTEYLIRTFGGISAINVICLAFASWYLAQNPKDLPETTRMRMMREAEEAETRLYSLRQSGEAIDGDVERELFEAITSAEEYGEERRDFAHNFDHLLHSTSKLFFFVIGLLLFGEAVKPLAAHVFGSLSPEAAFFGNSISAVADNALLGLLEVVKGMSQAVVYVLGISLALWGVGLVPGNVCNIVLKEGLHIPFGKWAKYGIPTAVGLAALNFILILLGASEWLTF